VGQHDAHQSFQALDELVEIDRALRASERERRSFSRSASLVRTPKEKRRIGAGEANVAYVAVFVKVFKGPTQLEWARSHAIEELRSEHLLEPRQPLLAQSFGRSAVPLRPLLDIPPREGRGFALRQNAPSDSVLVSGTLRQKKRREEARLRTVEETK
jgi:hypothetical protein